jgi:hypothetical protein
MVKAKSEEANGLAFSAMQMVQRDIGHPFLAWVVWKPQCREGCLFIAIPKCQRAGLINQISLIAFLFP